MSNNPSAEMATREKPRRAMRSIVEGCALIAGGVFLLATHRGGVFGGMPVAVGIGALLRGVVDKLRP